VNYWKRNIKLRLAILIASGWSLDQALDRAGWSLSYWSRVKSDRPATFAGAEKVADVLGCSCAALMDADPTAITSEPVKGCDDV
jgi:hypothetical protein